MSVHSKHEVSPYVAVGLYSHTLADSTFSSSLLLAFFFHFQRTVSVAQIASVLQTARVVAVSVRVRLSWGKLQVWPQLQVLH